MDTTHSSHDDSLVFDRYLAFYENLTFDSVSELDGLVTKDIHFVDPFNDVRGPEAIKKIFYHMFKRLNDPQFKIVEQARNGQSLYVRWDFIFSTLMIGFGRTQVVTGVSHVVANAENKIESHIDYWDASTGIYSKMPIIGLPVRIVRKLATL